MSEWDFLGTGNGMEWGEFGIPKILVIYSHFFPAGILPCQELAQMRSRLFLNLGLVQDSLGNSPESSKLLCKSVQLAE